MYIHTLLVYIIITDKHMTKQRYLAVGLRRACIPELLMVSFSLVKEPRIACLQLQPGYGNLHQVGG